jgi:hypothetical protein
VALVAPAEEQGLMKKREARTREAISRRSFTRGMVAAAAVAPLAGCRRREAPGAAGNGALPIPTAALGDGGADPERSPVVQARLALILAKYPGRFSPEQRAELVRLIARDEAAAKALFAFPLENRHEPAHVFRVRRPRKVGQGTP